MTILLTGSAGKTATALAEALSPDHQVLVASRRPAGSSKYPTVRFDWLDESTWSNVFSHSVTKDSPISAVYLVLPDLPEARQNAIAFVRTCIEHGVRRYVLLSAWENDEGGALLGGVHAELKAIGKEEGIGWAVLRPHFFMENFAETYHLDTIKNERKIYSAAGDGRKPFIAARDIAAVAKAALLSSEPPNTDWVITGPESLTYSEASGLEIDLSRHLLIHAQVADVLSDVLQTKIDHVSLDPSAFEQKLSGFGMSAEMAEYMTELDKKVSQGLGKEVTDNVRQVSGSQPQTFRQFAEENKPKWQA